MYDRWVRASCEGKLSGIVLLDLSAAFDLVDADLLIEKLRIYKFDDDIIAWIRSYLTNRSQAVWIDSVMSDFLHNPIGVHYFSWYFIMIYHFHLIIAQWMLMLTIQL